MDWPCTIRQLIHALLAHSASPKADVLFTGAPPFMLFFAIPLKVLRKVRLIYRITDFYPEVIIAELGKRSFVLRVRACHMVAAAARGCLRGAGRRPTTNSHSWRYSGNPDNG